jgi:hypothetical protein
MISYEAAYFVYGFGMTGAVAPWTNNNFIFKRSATSGTQAMIAAGINVPSAKWQGTATTGSQDMFTKVSTSAMAGATIGILSADWTDGQSLDMTTMTMVSNRTLVKVLAYQHQGQDCAWLPDSTSTSYDKKNVRDGHYPLWGPIHFFTAVDSSNHPTKPAVATFLGYFSGATMAPAGVNMLQLEITSRTVPSCAMHVQRSTEVGPVSAYHSTSSCDCYFDFTANGSTTCTSCTMANDPKCTGNTQCTMYGTTGYCEAK